MAVTMNSFWDNAGTVIPGGDAEYVVAEQPIAEYDNWFNYNIVADIQAVIDDVINKFNANTILKADTDNTPAALVVAEQTIVGRKTGNSIAALIDTEVLAIIGVEPGATADQTNTEIRDAVEAAADSNTFTDNDHTKLNGIESGATTDQSNAEIRTAVEAATDSNVFTDNDHTKLNGIEAAADVTDATNVAAATAVMDADFSASEGMMRKTGAGTYTVIKSNLSAAVAPTVDEDSGDGYGIGSQWIDTTADKAYVCLDVTVGAAVWTEVTAHEYDISSIDEKAIFTVFDSGTDIFHSHDAVASTTSASYVKMKTITLGYLPSSTLRIYFEIQGQSSGNRTDALIYRNGIGVGTVRSKFDTGYVAFTENISGWSKDDTLELWQLDVGGGQTAYCKNFRILGTSGGILNS